MREIPILMNGPMVRATLADLKTVTRRIVKPQPAANQGMVNAAYCGHPNLWLRNGPCRSDDPAYEWKCPYGQPGDRLWVRETFALEHCVEHDQEPPFNDGRPVRLADDSGPRWLQPHYKATDPEPELCCENQRCRQCSENDYGPHWRPSIHMPRWASRIALEVTGVRVERLQDITESQSIAEGCLGGHGSIPGYGYSSTPNEHFRHIWASTGGDWAANPWVWAVEFKRLTQERAHA